MGDLRAEDEFTELASAQQLHDALVQVGDEAPRLDLPDDLWAQWRRRRRNGRIVAVGVALAFVVALGGTATAVGGGTTRVSPAALTSKTPAVPDTIYAVPERLLKFSDSGTREVTWTPALDAGTDLAVGRAAAVLAVGASSGQLPMLVTAEDGEYVPLRPPGYSDAAAQNNGDGRSSAVALSEDGTLMAYGWWDPQETPHGPMPAGVRIVDLRSGELTEVLLEGGDGVDVDFLAFSPAGRYLVWKGKETRSWTATGHADGTGAAGRIDVRTAASTPVPLPRRATGAAVSDTGTVALANRHGVVLHEGGAQRRIRAELPGGPGRPPRFAADGARLALPGGAGTILILDISTGDVSSVDVSSEMGAHFPSPAGWTADGDVAVALDPHPQWKSLGVIDPLAPEGGRVVATLVPSDVDHVEVATGLMTGSQPTVERPEPDWPWTPGKRMAVTAATSVLALLLGCGVFLLWLRRRRR
jgi:hypothetical protein